LPRFAVKEPTQIRHFEKICCQVADLDASSAHDQSDFDPERRTKLV